MTGTEVVEGRVRDENAWFLGRDLADRGVHVAGVVMVGDRLEDVVGALRTALDAGPDLIVTTGGLGPTHDDRTMEAVARATGRGLALDAGALALVEARSRGVAGDVVPAVRRAVREKQATVPAGGSVIPPAGTAPGVVLAHGETTVVVLPGPPWEARAMWAAALSGGPVARVIAQAAAERRVLRLAGVVESEFVQALEGVAPGVRDGVEVAVCARGGELELVVRARPGRAGGAAEEFERAMDRAFGDALFSRDGREVDDMVADALSAAGATLAVAESCTGGGLGARLTARPGASEWFLGGVIAYADRVKASLLGVPEELIARHGAVSGECALAMARGVRERLASGWGVAVTGVAGPGGGTPDKPVGLVHLGLAGPGGDATVELHLRGGRELVRARSATEALHLLRRALAAHGA